MPLISCPIGKTGKEGQEIGVEGVVEEERGPEGGVVTAATGSSTSQAIVAESEKLHSARLG